MVPDAAPPADKLCQPSIGVVNEVEIQVLVIGKSQIPSALSRVVLQFQPTNCRRLPAWRPRLYAAWLFNFNLPWLIDLLSNRTRPSTDYAQRRSPTPDAGRHAVAVSKTFGPEVISKTEFKHVISNTLLTSLDTFISLKSIPLV